MNAHAIADLAGVLARYVLYLLVALSVAQLAVIVERGIFFWRRRLRRRDLRLGRWRAAMATDLSRLGDDVVAGESLEERVLAAAATHAEMGPDAVADLARARTLDERLGFENRLAFLGTLGNNAPFIGLFGTVLGIIHAFADLASGGGGASRAVMAGISEALVLTGVGLVVALPAVAAFNFFQRTLKTRVATAEAMSGELVAHLRGSGAGAAAQPAFRAAA